MTIVVNPTSQAGGGYESQRNSMKLRFRWFHPNVIWHVMHGFTDILLTSFPEITC